jgi:hypothetical protein
VKNNPSARNVGNPLRHCTYSRSILPGFGPSFFSSVGSLLFSFLFASSYQTIGSLFLIYYLHLLVGLYPSVGWFRGSTPHHGVQTNRHLGRGLHHIRRSHHHHSNAPAKSSPQTHTAILGRLLCAVWICTFSFRFLLDILANFVLSRVYRLVGSSSSRTVRLISATESNSVLTRYKGLIVALDYIWMILSR